MWPFRKENQKPERKTIVEEVETQKRNAIEEAVEALKEFRDIGEKFNYMGIEMIVESHFMMRPSIMPMITAAYRDKEGVLRHTQFIRRELPALMAENP